MRVLLVALAIGCGSDGDANCEERGNAVAAHQHDDGEGSHQGRPCLDSGCHLAGDTGAGAPAYVIAGTVYQKDATTAQAGAIVRLTPFDGGAPVTATTDAEGNFYLETSGSLNPFPSIPDVTACPDTETMIEGALDPSYGNCNANGCHQLGGGIGPGSITL
jgi:hypothetical protein